MEQIAPWVSQYNPIFFLSPLCFLIMLAILLEHIVICDNLAIIWILLDIYLDMLDVCAAAALVALPSLASLQCSSLHFSVHHVCEREGYVRSIGRSGPGKVSSCDDCSLNWSDKSVQFFPSDAYLLKIRWKLVERVKCPCVDVQSCKAFWKNAVLASQAAIHCIFLRFCTFLVYYFFITLVYLLTSQCDSICLYGIRVYL